MAKYGPNPFGKPSFVGSRTRRPGANLRMELKTGIELQRFQRDYRGRFMPGMQAAVFAAHGQVAWLAQVRALQDLEKKMRAHQPKRGRARQSLRDALQDPSLATIDARGVRINWDEALNARVKDERGVPYWRAVNDGYSRMARGHLFRDARGGLHAPWRSGGRDAQVLGGADPRMPRLARLEHTFRYSFEGYYFIQDSASKVRTELTQLGADIYLREMQFPDEMLAVLKFFGAGGRGRPQGPSAKSPTGVSFLPDPRRRQN